MYKHTKDTEWKNYAQSWTSWLEETQDIVSIWTDHGFIVKPSYGNGFQITNDSTYIPIIIKSAENYIAGRWNKSAKVMHSYDRGQWLKDLTNISGAVDQLMNLDLLYEAALLSNNTSFSSIASAYAETVMENNVRDDFSTFHVVRFDTTDGTVVSKGTIQGSADSSTWARGQSWSTYGFTMCYHYTQDERFLNTAIGLANYFIDHLPEDDGVTYWDFDVPYNSSEPKDASATSIVASALLELITFVEDESLRTKFKDAAFAMLESLASDKYLADPNITSAILLHNTAHKPANKRVDVPLVYSDYYFIEAMIRYQEFRTTATDINVEVNSNTPQNFRLEQNYPNPFNPTTTIKYELQNNSDVQIVIYDVLGNKIKELVNTKQSSGSHQVMWNGENKNGLRVNSGIYFYKMTANDFVAVNKVILIK